MAVAMSGDEHADRQKEEWHALVSFYGEDSVSMNSSSSEWQIKITPDAVLILKEIPMDYPACSDLPPIPRLVAPQWIMDEQRQRDLEIELVSLYEQDIEVAIMWVEHCRSALEDYQETNQNQQQAENNNHTQQKEANQEQIASKASTTQTFIPSNSKFGQPMRTFELAVVENPENMRETHHGDPFHPPKSGPSESMIAHVASVESMDHVNWVLYDLLCNDKKVGQASHNMIAYRFVDSSGCLVSDSDDDGEKGSGSKLASLLDLTDAQNCIVVVSRWYGGVHLGPARFKWIASVARQALEEAGFLS